MITAQFQYQGDLAAAGGKLLTIADATNLIAKAQVAEEIASALKQGDAVQFEIDGERVTLRRQTASDRTYLRGVEANLSEWNSPYDDEAYGDL